MYISMYMYTVILRVCATHHNDTRPHTTTHTNHTQPNTQQNTNNTPTHTHHTPHNCTQRTAHRVRANMPGPERWWTVPDKGTFSWSLGTILTCKSFVTFRSACFPQDRWSWTILSGKANDWRNRQHVVLDPLSNFKMGKIQRSLRWTHGTHDNSTCGAELSYSLSSVGELIWQCIASIVIVRK